MSDNQQIMIKKVTVADPEIAFKVQIDRTQITEKFSGISFYLDMTEGTRTLKSEMHIGRTAAYGNSTPEEITSNEFDVIFPFTDPHYAHGQTFHYKLTVLIYGMHLNRYNRLDLLHTIVIEGDNPVIADRRNLNYWIKDDQLHYDHVQIAFEKPGPNDLKVFDVVSGKPGLGVRIHWGDNIKPKVRKIRLIAGFETGKATINTWLNMDGRYTPEYLPLTIFAPYPVGAHYASSPPKSFSVELFDEHNNHVPANLTYDMPWSIGQTHSTPDTDQWQEVIVPEQELIETFPKLWEKNYHAYDAVKLAAFNRWATAKGYRMCIPIDAQAHNGGWKALAHKLRPEIVWSDMNTNQMTYTPNQWPVTDPEDIATAVSIAAESRNSNDAAWPSWEIGNQNGYPTLGAFTFSKNLERSTKHLTNTVSIDPNKGILQNIAQVMATARSLGYMGGIIPALNTAGPQKIIAFLK